MSVAGAFSSRESGRPPFGSQTANRLVVVRRQLTDHQLEQVVGEDVVAHQRGTVQIGTHDAALDCALGPVAVAGPTHHSAERPRLRSEPGVPLVVLEAGQELVTGGAGALGEDLAHGASALDPATR